MITAKETVGDDCNVPRMLRYLCKQFPNATTFCRQQFFQTLDGHRRRKERFHQKHVALVRDMEDTITGRSTNVSKQISETYRQGIDTELLETYMKLLPSAITETQIKPPTVEAVVSSPMESPTVRRLHALRSGQVGQNLPHHSRDN